MSIFRRGGPEVGAENSIIKSASFAEYMERNGVVVPEDLKSTETKKNQAGAGLYELWQEM